MEAIAFGDRLRIARKYRSLKQADLADQLDVAVDTVRRWEAGSHEPKLSDVVKLAGALEMSIGELVGEVPITAPSSPPTEPIKRKKDAKLDKIVIQHGLLKVEIPATPEGYAIVKAKLDEFTVDSIPPQDLAEGLQEEEGPCK